MANILFLNKPFVSAGLNTFNLTVPSANIYRVTVQATFPSALGVGDGAGSGGVASGGQSAPVTSSLLVTINRTSSPVYVSTLPTPTQSSLQFNFDLLCAASDALQVVFSSSNPNDQALNALKYSVQIMNVNGV